LKISRLQILQITKALRGSVCAIVLIFLVPPVVQAQQPFITDDANVTPKGRFHFEFSNEFDVLQRSAFPNLKQNTADFELNYGLFEDLEVGIALPVLTIFNARGTGPETLSGIGDMSLSLKYNFLAERENSRVPALTVALNFELPTGDPRRQLGSGLADFYINGVLQKSLTKRTKLRLNGGILFSGNETTGVLGIRSRGTVYTSGGSIVREFTPKLYLGAELTGAVTSELDLGKGQLQALIGGNYLLKENLSLDFAILSGKFVASPRAGVQLGVSIDF
jgi:hypothetical protein